MAGNGTTEDEKIAKATSDGAKAQDDAKTIGQKSSKDDAAKAVGKPKVKLVTMMQHKPMERPKVKLVTMMQQKPMERPKVKLAKIRR